MKILPAALVLAIGLLSSVDPSFAEDAKEAKAPARQDPIGGGISELHKKGFNTLVTALSKTDYADKVQAGGFTVLAPTDVAFRDLPKAQLDALLADKEKLTSVLSHHLIEGKVSTSDLKAGKVKTLGGSEVQAKLVDGKLKIGAATIVRPDVPSTNGVIQGIDKLLQP